MFRLKFLQSKNLILGILLGSSLVGMNISFGWLIQYVGVPTITNIYPLGLQLPFPLVTVIVAFVLTGLILSHSARKYPIPSLFIATGSVSNLIERVLFGSVVDYFNIGIAYANLADLQLWLGIALLNYIVWIEPLMHKPKTATAL